MFLLITTDKKIKALPEENLITENAPHCKCYKSV